MVRFVGPSSPVQPAEAEGPFAVLYVVDGDTIAVETAGQREYVRLLGIDAPERGSLGGWHATDLLERILRRLRLVRWYAPVYLEGKGRDRYNRRLSYVWSSGRNTSIELVQRGAARYANEWGRSPYWRRLESHRAFSILSWF